MSQLPFYLYDLLFEFVSDLRHDGSFLRVLSPVSSTNKTGRHDITEILLKVALSTIIHPSNHRSTKIHPSGFARYSINIFAYIKTLHMMEKMMNVTNESLLPL